MAGFGSGDGISYHVCSIFKPDVFLALLIGAVGSTPYLALLGQRTLEYFAGAGQTKTETLPATASWIVVVGFCALLLLAVVSVAGNNYNPFIYFRF